MTDRELLELAAKAAGANFEVDESTGAIEILSEIGGCSGSWNPLTDDGDALRLAVKCQIVVGIGADTGNPRIAYNVHPGGAIRTIDIETSNGDREPPPDIYAATRRAIVRAAAEIGAAQAA